MSNDYLVVNQAPEDMANARTALADVDRSAHGDAAGVTLREADLSGFIVLRGVADDAQLLEIAEEVLGIRLPVTPLAVAELAGVCVRWISPTEWLITLPFDRTGDIEAALRDRLGDTCAVVDNSGGMVAIILSGDAAETVIRKSTSYNITIDNFPPGKVVTTTLASAQAIMRRVANDEFELLIRRSFADYVWRWLCDASAEFGAGNV